MERRMGKKVITALRLLLFDRRSFVERIFWFYYGRYDIFIFYVQAKIRSYFLSNKKRLFIDLGANIGQAHQFFKGIYPNKYYDYILVEPNNFCVEKLNLLVDYNIKILQAAAWIKKEKKLFYGITESGNITSLGASIIENHKTVSYNINKEKAVLVETFDFSEFLLEQSAIYDEIIVKMDIESSEYDVLERLIDSNNIKLIDRLFVEFHSDYMKESKEKKLYRLREKRLIEMLPNFTRLHIWV